MILFELTCAKEHSFEGWFRDNATYEAQEKAHEIVCPACGDTRVRKAMMAPRIGKGGKREKAPDASPVPADGPADAPKMAAKLAREQQAQELRRQLLELRAKVEADCDYVGPRFAEEARRIHYGESERHNIYGEASKDDAEALADEGIEFGTIPWLPRSDA
jgi:hypothetical protein